MTKFRKLLKYIGHFHDLSSVEKVNLMNVEIHNYFLVDINMCQHTAFALINLMFNSLCGVKVFNTGYDCSPDGIQPRLYRSLEKIAPYIDWKNQDFQKVVKLFSGEMQELDYKLPGTISE